MGDIDEIVDKLIIFNKAEQIKSKIELCNAEPSRPICGNVIDNNYESWHDFLSKNNNNNLFSKGVDRLKSWSALLKEEPKLYFYREMLPTSVHDEELYVNAMNKIKHFRNSNKNVYYFILSALIIVFQVFGDGNHRTAAHFYKKMTNKDITSLQMGKINTILNNLDYNAITINPIKRMDELLNRLYLIAYMVGGKGKRVSRKVRRKVRRKECRGESRKVRISKKKGVD
jgi:hypothetical protein